MSKSRAVPPLEPKRCALCKGVLSERRPVYLIHTPTGAIVGPYHAGCAEKEVLAAKAAGPASWQVRPEVVEYGKAAREETLPW